MKSIDGLKSHKDKVATNVIKRKSVVKTTTINKKISLSKKPAKLKIEEVSEAPSDAPNITTAIEPNATNEKAVDSGEIDPGETSEVFDFDLTHEDIKNEEQNKKKADKAKRKAEKKKKKRVSVARKIITSLLLVIVLGVIGVVCWGMVWGDEIINRITGGNTSISEIIGALVTDELVELKTDENGRTNILLFGTSGYNMDGAEGDGVHDGAALTDSIMVISFDQKTYDLAMVNLPRDLKAGATCTATGKINEVYWCANMDGEDESAGANALAYKIDEILGVDIQYWVHVDWQALVTLVDALDGIDVVLDEDIADYDYTGAVYEAGVVHHLNGEQALGLARARHGTEGGDFSRGNSQQKIMVAIKNKLMENGIGWSKAMNIINALGDNVRTNISLPEMKTGLWLIGEMDLDSMRQVPLVDYENNIYYVTTGMVNGISYVLPSAGEEDYYAIKQYIREQFTIPEKPEDEPLESAEDME